VFDVGHYKIGQVVFVEGEAEFWQCNFEVIQFFVLIVENDHGLHVGIVRVHDPNRSLPVLRITTSDTACRFGLWILIQFD
jgi:hypothetical protein